MWRSDCDRIRSPLNSITQGSSQTGSLKVVETNRRRGATSKHARCGLPACGHCHDLGLTIRPAYKVRPLTGQIASWGNILLRASTPLGERAETFGSTAQQISR